MMDKMNGMFCWWEGDCEDRSMKGKRKKKGVCRERDRKWAQMLVWVTTVKSTA